MSNGHGGANQTWPKTLDSSFPASIKNKNKILLKKVVSNIFEFVRLNTSQRFGCAPHGRTDPGSNYSTYLVSIQTNKRRRNIVRNHGFTLFELANTNL